MMGDIICGYGVVRKLSHAFKQYIYFYDRILERKF